MEMRGRAGVNRAIKKGSPKGSLLNQRASPKGPISKWPFLPKGPSQKKKKKKKKTHVHVSLHAPRRVRRPAQRRPVAARPRQRALQQAGEDGHETVEGGGRAHLRRGRGGEGREIRLDSRNKICTLSETAATLDNTTS